MGVNTMGRYDKMEQTYKQYQDIRLRYETRESKREQEMNEANYQIMKDMLKEAGFSLQIKDHVMTLSVIPLSYARSRTRNAGRRHKHVWDPERSTVIRYSDIVRMLESMTDREICEKIRMPESTYYRHKKVLMQSSYYQTLDRNRLDDLDYLQSVKDNRVF